MYKNKIITKGAIKEIIIVFAIILIIILATKYIQIYGVEIIREKVEVMGIFAPIGIFLLRSISIVVPALPSTAYSLLAGALLGFKKGLITICLADLVSCSLSFLIARNYGKNFLKYFLGIKLISRIENFGKKYLENNTFLMTGLLMTGLFDFVCYGVGFSRIPWYKFAPALVISILLSNPPIVALGSGILDNGKQLLIFALLGVIFLGVISNKFKSYFRYLDLRNE